LIWVVAQFFEGASRKSEMDPTDDFRLLVGCLEQWAVVQLDDAGTGIRARGEPELIQQVDHLAPNGYSTRRHRWRGIRARTGHACAHLGLPHELATPHTTCVNGVGAWLPACPGDVRGQGGRQGGVLAGSGRGAGVGRGGVEPRGPAAALCVCPGTNDQPGIRETVQMFANRVRVLTCQPRESRHCAGLRLVDQNIQDARPGG